MSPSTELQSKNGPPPLTSWLPVVIMGLMSLISYLDRSVLAILAPTILKDTGITAQQYFWVVSAFSIAYVIGNPFWGHFIDRFGPRTVVPLAVLVWTVASVSHAYVATFLGFVLARIVLGFGEGATFPGGLRTVHDTLPEGARGTGISIAYSGGSLGAIIAPLIITPMALRFGWQASFFVTGVLGVAWILLWALTPTAAPSEPSPLEHKKSEPDIQFGDRKLWAFIFLYAFGALPLAFGTYAAPLYLSSVLGLSQAAIGKLVWLLPAGWELGYIVAGQLFDWRKRTGKAFTPSWFRLVTSGFVLPGLCLVITPSISSVPLVLLLLTLPMFTTGGLVIAALRYGESSFPGGSGFIAGIGAGTWGLVVFFVMLLIGNYFKHAQYANAFRLVTVFPIIGFVGWQLLAFTDRKSNEQSA